MNTIASRDQFKPIRVRENLVVNLLQGVVKTRVEVRKNEKCRNTRSRREFPQHFPVLPNFHDLCIHKCAASCQLKPHFDVMFACITAGYDFLKMM